MLFKTRSRTFVIFLSIIFFPALVFSSPLNVSVDAESAILINAETGAILYQKNAYTPMYPASVTKIAIALYAIEAVKNGKGKWEDRVLISYDMVRKAPASLKQQCPDQHPPYRQEPDGTNIGLMPGEEMDLKALLQGLMLCSGNDAANAIGFHLSGHVENFVQEVNAYLKSHKIEHTRFLNPHGLHHEEHKTTAYDLGRITMLAMKEPIFREIVGSAKILRAATNKQPAGTFVQFNRLLRPGQFYYPKATGVKTGYYSHAGYNLVAAAEDKDRNLIAVLLNDKDTASRYRDAIHLFEEAFHETKLKRTLFAAGQDVFRLEVPRAKTPIEGILKENLTLSYYPSEEPKIKAKIVWKEVKLPIAEGSIVAEMVISTTEGTPLISAPIYATHDVNKTYLGKVTDWVKDKKMVLFHYRLSIIIGLVFFIILLALLLRVKKEDDTKEEKP